MRTAAIVFLLYCCLRGAAVFAKPEMILEMFPGIAFTGRASRTDNPAENKEVALASARALGTLVIACGLLALGGNKGRMASLAVIFAMFYQNHIVDGLAHPPMMPVVATNIVVLALVLVEAVMGGSLGKLSYAAMQGGFGLVFLTEAPELVQDPFTFATEGTNSLYVGQKLGFAVGCVLLMHAAMTLLKPPAGCIAAMAAVFGMTAKLSLVDGIVFPKSTYIAASICTALCVGDFFMGGGKAKKA